MHRGDPVPDSSILQALLKGARDGVVHELAQVVALLLGAAQQRRVSASAACCMAGRDVTCSAAEQQRPVRALLRCSSGAAACCLGTRHLRRVSGASQQTLRPDGGIWSQQGMRAGLTRALGAAAARRSVSAG